MELVEEEPVERVENVVVGLPDVGLVGSIAAHHMVRTLEMEEVGPVDSENLAPVLVVHEGRPRLPLRLFRSGDTVTVASEVPLEPDILRPFSRTIIEWARSKDTERIISLSGIAVQNRVDIEKPEVFFIDADSPSSGFSSKADVDSLEEGFLVGPHAAVMKEAMQVGMPNVILVAQSHYRYPDPGAAASVLEVLNRLLDLDIELQELLERAEEIRVMMRELMQRTTQTMQQLQKQQEQEIPAMYR